MELRLTWEAILAMIAVLGFFSTVIALYVNLQFSKFAETIVEKMDKRYVQRNECALREMRLRTDMGLAAASEEEES